MQPINNDGPTGAEPELHGDVLDEIFSRVPLIDLVPASHVSRTWRRSVRSSLRRFNRPKPWLVVRRQTRRPTPTTTTHLYDPRSNLWMEEFNHNQQSIPISGPMRSSHSGLVYILTPAKLSFSLDALFLNWVDVAPPKVWRTDPIVAKVGKRIVVAGGAWDFEDDPLSVEIYDTEIGKWDSCGSMPDILKDSAASTWLSVAATDHEMFVTEKSSGIGYSFDPVSKIWVGPFDLRPDPSMYSSAISYSGSGQDPIEKLLMVGLIGDSTNVKSVKLWEVCVCHMDDANADVNCKLIGEVPTGLVERLKGMSGELTSVNLRASGEFVYICNPSEPEEVVVFEILGGFCRWGSVRNPVVDDGNRMERSLFSCCEVGMRELQQGRRRLRVVESSS